MILAIDYCVDIADLFRATIHGGCSMTFQQGSTVASVKKRKRPFHCPPLKEVSVAFQQKNTKIQYTQEKPWCGRYSISTTFLSILGFGVDAGAEVDTRYTSIIPMNTTHK